MPRFDIRKMLMGNPDIFADLKFLQISTLPFELPPINNITLGSKIYVNNAGQKHSGGDNLAGAYASGVLIQRAQRQINFPGYQLIRDSQMTTYSNNNGKVTKYDMISLYSFKQTELLGLFSNPIDYYHYCYIDNNKLN